MIERKRDLFEAAYLQYALDENGYSLIYLEEFHINMHSEEMHNLSPINTKAIIFVNQNSWIMLFELLSQKGE